MMIKKLIKILKYMLAATLLVFIIAAIYVEEKILPFTAIVPLRQSIDALPSVYGLKADSIDVLSIGDVHLKGFFVHANHPKAKATILLLHGIGSCKEEYLPLAKDLADRGYNTALFDQRAHGKSGGKYCTYGWYEKMDVSKIIDTIQPIDAQCPIGVFGCSLGGAIALQSLAYDKRIRFGVIESTFNTLENVVAQYGYNMMYLKNTWITRHILQKSAKIANFNPFEVQPRESCKQITQPIFMAHGDIDENIPIAFGRDNFKALASQDKQFIEVHGAGHFNVTEVGGAAYHEKIMRFFESHTQK